MSDMKDILSRLDGIQTPSARNAGDPNAMLSILLRMDESLDKNQKSVNQLSAEFKPKTTPVLTAKQDPKNPMAGKLVGGCEESKRPGVDPDSIKKIVWALHNGSLDWLDFIQMVKKDPAAKAIKKEADIINQEVYADLGWYADNDKVTNEIINRLWKKFCKGESWDEFKSRTQTNRSASEDPVAEDILTQVKQGLADYLRGLVDKPRDSHIFNRPQDREIGKRVTIDRDLIPRQDPVKKARQVVITQAPIKTIKIDDINECGIYGDEDLGFEIRRGEKTMPTRFKALDQAIAAAELYAARRKQQNSNPDYREEK